MKSVVLFFLLLSILLLGGNPSAKASKIRKTIHNTTLTANNTLQELFSSTPHEHLLLENTDFTDECAFVTSYEDDDETEDIIKKHVSEKYFLTQAATPVFTYYCSCTRLDSKAASTKSSHNSSSIFILHRALRL